MSAAAAPGVSAWMAEAAASAREGRFRVEPNPMVGATVLDAGGRPVGRGFHARFGGPHAEVVALEMAGERARGGTLVVTLEPCAHARKKTPPCVPRVIAAGVARVVAGAPDPNPMTAGVAAEAFASAGIAFEVLPAGTATADVCRALAARHARHLGSSAPWVVAKWAASLDGRIADARGASRWISSERSRAVVADLRAAADAVVVGVETVLADDPRLVCGGEGVRPGLRVVLDSRLRTPATARVAASASETPTLVVTTSAGDALRRRELETLGVEIEQVPIGADGRVDVRAAFEMLHRRGVRRALVEAGGRLTAACLRAGLVRQCAVFVAPVVIGGAGPTPFEGEGWPLAAAPRLEESRVTAVDGDALLEGYWPA